MSTHEHSSLNRPWWLLLLPIAFLFHIGEEWWAGEGFAVWTARALGSPISTTRFLVVNSIAWPLFALLTILGICRRVWSWFPTTLATIVVLNTALHTLGTLTTATYSPGLVTSLVLYVPVGGLALLFGLRHLSPRAFQLAVLTGVLIHAAVIVIALA